MLWFVWRVLCLKECCGLCGEFLCLKGCCRLCGELLCLKGCCGLCGEFCVLKDVVYCVESSCVLRDVVYCVESSVVVSDVLKFLVCVAFLSYNFIVNQNKEKHKFYIHKKYFILLVIESSCVFKRSDQISHPTFYY